MAKKRLTLSMDIEAILAAKALAKDRGITVSELFSEFITKQYQKSKLKNIGPKTRAVSGILDLPEDFDYKECMTDILLEKYGFKKK